MRYRLVHLGVAAAMAAATVTATGLVQSVGAADSGAGSVLVPITPCRLIDTRAGTDNVGTRTSPIGAADTATFQVTGTNGNCTIPSAATAIVTNATAVNPTASSYITFYPADASPRPTASNVNFVAGAAPTPNQVTVGLSAAGAIGVYNNAGNVDLVVDIAGYYVTAPSAAGPQGPVGPTGAAGPTCPDVGCAIMFSGFDAVPVQSGAPITYAGNGCAWGHQLRVPLDLPIGAIPTKVAVRYIDTNTAPDADMSFRLTKAVSPTSDTVNAGGTFTVDLGQTRDLTLSPGVITAVAADSYYYLTLIMFSNVGTATVQFCGVDVTYHF